MHLNYGVPEGRITQVSLRIFSIVLGLLLCCRFAAQATPPPTGIAPLLAPAGGFAIDGNLLANTPAANAGDWLPSTNSGSGGNVLDASGVPLNTTTTFHFADAFNSGLDNTFSGGKWMANPTNWQWTTSKANSKTDINNVLLHTSLDADGHSWVVIAADRQSTSGASYIDFEFLQNSYPPPLGGLACVRPSSGYSKSFSFS